MSDIARKVAQSAGSAAKQWPMRRTWLRLASTTPLLLVTPRVFAHHGWSSFDTERPVYLEGKVKSVRWQNPHAEILIDLKPALALPDDLPRRPVPAQSQPVAGASVLARARLPTSGAKVWTLELAPLFRVEAWRIAQPAPGSSVAAVGYALVGEKQPLLRVEYLFIDGKAYGLRSMPAV